MKKILQYILKKISQSVLAKYNPQIIGITGSVGKTSTKSAIYTVLKKKFKTRSSIKSYNNEFGLPLTILGINSAPGRSLIEWLRVLFHGCCLLLLGNKNYPEILILEMGADKQGDLKYLTSIAKPSVGVITSIGPTHLEFFKNIANIKQEKSFLIKLLLKNNLAVLNYDDSNVRSMQKITKANVLSYGFDAKADVWASDLNFHVKKSEVYLAFKINYQGKSVPVNLANILAKHQVYPCLAAVGIGLHYKMNLLEISQALENYQVPVGRLKIIRGIKNSMILDDTYNAAPDSTLAALEALSKFGKKSRKIVVLGDMLELGKESESGHRKVGIKAGKIADILFLIGERSCFFTKKGALKAGMSGENIHEFDTSVQAGLPLQNILQKNDLVLIKGSQGVRMEKLVLEIMREPLRAGELLVRQEKEWLSNV